MNDLNNPLKKNILETFVFSIGEVTLYLEFHEIYNRDMKSPFLFSDLILKGKNKELKSLGWRVLSKQHDYLDKEWLNTVSRFWFKNYESINIQKLDISFVLFQALQMRIVTNYSNDAEIYLFTDINYDDLSIEEFRSRDEFFIELEFGTVDFNQLLKSHEMVNSFVKAFNKEKENDQNLLTGLS